MQFRQFYLGCLSHASYYLGSEGEAAIIDPQRDIDQYIAEAAAHEQKIKYVIETHSHADFVSGHLELAKRTGAKIVYGERANTRFETLKVKDGDTLNVGKVKLTFRETPGHTPEGITIVAQENGGPAKVFTGDTLFIGDVGRPDLVGSVGFTSEQMAAMLYDSIHEKILPLADTAEIYPAHGAGSLCGKSLSKETWSTLGEQRKFNYALQPMSQEDFVKIVAAGQSEVPQYFPKSAARNLEGSSSLDELPAPRQISTSEVVAFDGVVLDVRKNFEYGAGHVPNSINIGLGGQFASWAGTLIPIGTPLAIVATTKEQIDEAVMRLARVGHETVSGYILFADFAGDQTAVKQMTVEEAHDFVTSGRNFQFVDVRRIGEYEGGHAAGADSRSLEKLDTMLDGLDPAAPTYVICAGGYRSSIGCGILENAGFNELYNVTGGTTAWVEAKLPIEASTAQS
jgi:glyoxylase-like metal-dependent hydrolase (beta-lactamase superfamily II)